MNAAEMKARCEKVARTAAAGWDLRDATVLTVCEEIADAIAALPVEADPRDAQIAALLDFVNWIGPLLANGGITYLSAREEGLHRARAALAATKPKGDAK